MGATASQITGVSIVYSTVCSGADKKKTAKLCVTGYFCEGNSPIIGPVTRKMFPFDDVIVCQVTFRLLESKLYNNLK